MRKLLFSLLLLLMLPAAKAYNWHTSTYCVNGWTSPSGTAQCTTPNASFDLACTNPSAKLFITINASGCSMPHYRSVTECIADWGTCCDCPGLNYTYCGYIPYNWTIDNCTQQCSIDCGWSGLTVNYNYSFPPAHDRGISGSLYEYCWIPSFSFNVTNPYLEIFDTVYAMCSARDSSGGSLFMVCNVTLYCDVSNITCPEYCAYGYYQYTLGYWHYYNGINVGGTCQYTVEQCPYGCDPTNTTCAGVPAPVCGNGICESGETHENCPQDCPTPGQVGGVQPIPVINATEWEELGFGWALPLLTPIFILTFIALMISGIIGLLTRPEYGGIAMLVFLVIYTLYGIYPPWIGWTIIIIAGFIVTYTVGKTMGWFGT